MTEHDRKPPCDPLIASTFGAPVELPPRAFLTNDERLMEARSRRCTEREAREEVEAQQDNGAFS